VKELNCCPSQRFICRYIWNRLHDRLDRWIEQSEKECSHRKTVLPECLLSAYSAGDPLPAVDSFSTVVFLVLIKMAQWKNRISFTSMKLRKSFVKPVTRQNISSCSVLLLEIIVHDAFNLFSERLLIYASACMTISGERTEQQYNCRFSAASLALRAIFIRQKCPPIYASCMTISGGRSEQRVIGFGELAAVD